AAGRPSGGAPWRGRAAWASEPSAGDQQAQRAGQLSPEGKGAQGGSARNYRPGARPGDCGPGRCPSWVGRGRRVPARAAGGGGAWLGSVGAAAVGAHAAFWGRGVRGPGRLPAGARAPAQPAAPGWPVAGAVARAHARDPLRGRGPCGSASPRSSPGHAPARAALGAAGGHRAGLTSRDTPSPVDPDTVEVLMTFEPDPADLALSSIPGHETFDPRRHRFSEEELKPQPIMKKARKIQVPEEQKDEKYWSRRYKNNEAAKRSRDARRLKENQISVRAAFLEKENALLRQEVVSVRQELSHYRAVLSRYQAQHGAL
uniref:Carbonic anhydrase 11 n=1 Tax=Marmota marmota marmota TaxID=9994 RepID=A0A8C5ZF98_MARMA